VAITVIDVQSVKHDNPQSGVKTFAEKPPRAVSADVVIAGGGMGGLAAALRVLTTGLKVCLTEETDWIGGQATAQGVSALDENYLVETSGAPRAYQLWREAIRQHYQSLGLKDIGIYGPALNPGNCWVSWLAFEPLVGLKEFEILLRPFVETGQLIVFLRHKVISAQANDHGQLSAIRALDLQNGDQVLIEGQVFIDATELGDLLPLSGISYVSGAESVRETAEPHAPEEPSPENVQDFTYPFVLQFLPGENHVIEKPPHYDEFVARGKFSFNGYRMFECAENLNGGQFLPFWHYRRLIDASLFPQGTYGSDLSMINWDSNDMRDQNIIDKPPSVMAERLAMAKSLSLGFLYWLQTEAKRDDGGNGYPELKLCFDVFGTDDGLSKYPYIRESRRIVPKQRITETDVSAACNSGSRSKSYWDSVGIGLYPIDIHGRQDVPGAAQPSRPFQIPLGALLPAQDSNVIAAAKNIGTTHITNGCYRLHPVEWAIGEAAGLLAALSILNRTTPAEFAKQTHSVRDLQRRLVAFGTPIVWFDDLPTDHPAFAEAQLAAVSAQTPLSSEHLHWNGIC
jgi:hypothetical protein